MKNVHELVSEIHRLIDEQMRTLEGKLTPEEAAHYTLRKQRIGALLRRLA